MSRDAPIDQASSDGGQQQDDEDQREPAEGHNHAQAEAKCSEAELQWVHALDPAPAPCYPARKTPNSFVWTL